MKAIEMIKEHIEELDKSISKTCHSISSGYSVYASLMHAKTNALNILVQAEENYRETMDIQNEVVKIPYEKGQLIYKQIVSAMMDDCETFATIYYEAGTGATQAAVNAAKEFGAVLMTSSQLLKCDLVRKTQMKWLTVGDLHPLSNAPRTFIADCLTDSQLKQLKEIARDRKCKIIAIKRTKTETNCHFDFQ
ncbi:hypothetical protein [Brevibacillus sp. JB24b]|uniref:hypothetical protein n=1 Tax=Brevibacillus sp. JB24b TaxID=3422308 RepID=UPI003F684874